jgi:hypothetical protein
LSLLLRRQLPILVLTAAAMLVIVDYFLRIPGTSAMVTDLQNWGIVLAAFALGFGALNLFLVHTRHISKRTPGQWPYSIWLLFMIVVFAFTGVFLKPTSPQYSWMYNSSFFALSATIYSSTGFYIASGCYRSLRARNSEAAVLMIVGLIVLLKNCPAVAVASPMLVNIEGWLSSVPTTSAMRGIMMGGALGAMALGIRTMIGRETGFLGRLAESER